MVSRFDSSNKNPSFHPEMETIDGNTITTETLTGVFSSFHPPDDDSCILLKPTSEERGDGDLRPENEVLCDKMTGGGEDLGPENEVLCDKMTAAAGGGGGGGTVVVTTTVIEKTQISVVEMIQEDKEEKKGVFSNLVGDSEENMVFVDAKGSFSGENGSEKSVSEENAIGDPVEVEKQENLAEIFESGEDKKPENVDKSETKSENQENVQDSGGDPVGVEKQENGAEIIESGEDSRKNDKGNAREKKQENVDKSETKPENQENGQDSGEEMAENDGEHDENEEEEDHDFVVGDFVWGKIKSHPWWPGQIYNPSDASDYAATLKRKGHLLVAYFGDGSFSWCSPSQLKPFIDYFEVMSNQSDSKKFVNAVQKGLEAVGWLVEEEMMCKCQTFDRDGGGYTAAVNSGIKAGVDMPKGNTVKVLIDRMNPVELFSTLKGFATTEVGVKMGGLEFVVLKSCLTAFYGQKGGQPLSEYHDPMYIEGLEDRSRSGFVSDSDVNGPSESGDGKLHQKRKQKSVAELLGEDESKIKKAKTSGGLKKERKRKPLVVSVSLESDHDSGGGGIEEETMSPRQRKKSKYLSPPYTSPIWSGKHSGSFKAESEKVPEMAAKHLEDSLKRNSSRRRSRTQDSKEEEEKVIIDGGVNVNKVLDGLLRAALDPSGFVEKKKVPEVSEFVSAFRNAVFEDGSDEKKAASDIELIERKLEAMREMVKRCEEGEMSEEMKGSLEEGFKEVLEKVGKMK